MDMDFKVPVSVGNSPEPKEPQAAVPTPTSEQQPQAEPPAPLSGPKNKPSKKWLILLLVLILLLGGSATAWWWQKKSSDKKASKQADQSASSEGADQSEMAEALTCAEGYTTYENQDLGFGFCYLATWGSVSVNDAKLAPADTGSRWILEFSAKTQPKLAVVSTDWSTEVARGGECYFPSNETPDFTGYTTDWEIDYAGTDVTFAIRKLDAMTDEYFITEDVGEFFGGVCARGTVVVDITTYPQVTVTYFVSLNDDVATPGAHVDSPNVLFTESERTAFIDLTKSVRKL